MKPDSTEQLGLNAVIEYESKKGRIASRVHKCGYNLKSIATREERHIEVKATTDDHFTSRWLEELGHDKFQNDEHFYFYLSPTLRSHPESSFMTGQS